MWPFKDKPTPREHTVHNRTVLHRKTIKGSIRCEGWLRLDFTDGTSLQIKLGEYLGSEDNAIVYLPDGERPITL